MLLPKMRYDDGINTQQQISFGGLNHTEGASDGDVWDMKNMTSDHYPVLASRKKRKLYRTLETPGGMFAWDGLAWVDGTDFVFDGQVRGTVTEGQKRFAAIGAYIVIFPDKAYYNVDSQTFGNLESCWVGNSLTFENGTLFDVDAAANTIRCDGVNWENWFRQGDAVEIRGCTAHTGNNQTIIIREVDGDKLRFYEHSFTVGDGSYTEWGKLEIRRTVPDMVYLCENNNRLWGCGRNTIYASKLGDPFNWNVFDGLSTDSYAVDTGSAGAFTGCISYQGYPTFFKEQNIYKVYGTQPGNFEVMGSASTGVAEGCGKSLAIAGEVLFYLSRKGMMAYKGGVPQAVGAALGTESFRMARGGSDGSKYYVCLLGQDGWGMYVYDTGKGVWHKEDSSRMVDFVYSGGVLYMLNDAGEIWMAGSGEMPEGKEEEEIEWMVEFADYAEQYTTKYGIPQGNSKKKIVSKIQLRMELEAYAQARVLLQFDSGAWEEATAVMGSGKKKSFFLPVIPRRGDHYRIRIEGKGAVKIYSMSRELAAGSAH